MSQFSFVLQVARTAPLRAASLRATGLGVAPEKARHPTVNHRHMKRMLVVVALTIVTSRELVAQLPKPVIEQPTPVTGVSSGTHGPKMPTMPRKTDPASRAAHSDTTEILHAMAQKLRTKDVDRSAVTIQNDTAWVSLTDPKYRGVVYRLERRHSWKVVDR